MRAVIGLTFAAALLWSFPAAATPPTAPSILAEMHHVADWELAHLDQAAVPASSNAEEPLGWMRSAFYAGLTALADCSPDPKYADAIFMLGAQEHWQLGPRLFHADDQLIAQSWIWAFSRRHDEAIIAATRQRFDAIIKANPSGPLLMSTPDICTQRWCWSDALFMAPPGWVALSRITRDPRYLAYADKEYRASTALLFDPDHSLFYRDSSFKGRSDAAGRKLFWSRGNGWAYAGLARILAALPPGSPSAPFYRDLFLSMSRKIAHLQKPDGCWPPSLLDPKPAPPETSGTALFTFGLAWGVRAGLLPDQHYRVAAEKGWTCLIAAVDTDGRLGWVQSQNDRPDSVQKQDTQPYGAGAFLLAGSALYDLALHH